MTVTAGTAKALADRMAEIEAGCHSDVIAYHYHLVSSRLTRRLRDYEPGSDEGAAMVAIIRAADSECVRRTQAAPGYGTAG